MLRDFKLRSSAFLERTPVNDLELFFVMQHYGMPTRLLDWTESYLAALYFAIEDVSREEDAAVWILAPAALNAAAKPGPGGRVPMSNAQIFDKYTIPDLDAETIPRNVEAVHPLALRPTRSTMRIVAQRGMFTIHGSDRSSLHAIAAGSGSAIGLHKVAIAGKERRRLKKALFLAGISRSALFPDLGGLCEEIRFRYSREYLEDPSGAS